MCVCVCVCVCAHTCVALLSSSLRKYAKMVGTRAKKRLLQLTCNGELAEKKVVLMSVPSSTDTLFEKKTRQAIGELLELLQTTAPGSTVALLLKWKPDMADRKSAKIIFHAIVEGLAAEHFQRHNLVLKLYFDKGASADHSDEFHSMDKHLTTYNWATSGCFSKYATDVHLFITVSVIFMEFQSQNAVGKIKLKAAFLNLFFSCCQGFKICFTVTWTGLRT